MRLDFELPDERWRLRELEPAELPRRGDVAEVPSPPPPDALAVRMERNRALAASRVIRQHPRLERQRHKREQSSFDIADQPRVERRPRRDRDPENDLGLGIHLRREEVRALTEVGRFRVIAVRDLAETVYGGDRSALKKDLGFLRNKGIVSLDSVNARRDGCWRQPERIEVVTLTRRGKKMVRQVGDLRPEQQIYAGLLKLREAEHDTQVYRAYLKEVERIEQLGGQNPRVILDFEIKCNLQKAMYAEHKAEPERDLDEIKEQVARQFNLPLVAKQIQIPDARIEYQLDQGSRSAVSDIEVLTGSYHPGHLKSKAQAGFRLFAAARDRARLGREIEDEHHMLHDILDLG